MTKYSVVEYLLTKVSKYTPKQKKLLRDIEMARQELERCRTYFDSVKNPYLVDYAIYMEEAAKAKYMYLLNEMRGNNTKVKYKSVDTNRKLS